ncbi:hypothetical protein [Actinomadura atramentaria]|uniref:hypothetical protein n=1 Tax=Actinomadura atramentaria TaxID=1990 RepID=UPI0012F8B441|nr:hypothetical protein [Actinomadura atramentaria]
MNDEPSQGDGHSERGLPVPPALNPKDFVRVPEDPWIALIVAAASAVAVARRRDQSEELSEALEAPYRRLEEALQKIKLQAAEDGLVDATLAAMNAADGYLVTPRLAAAHTRISVALREVAGLERPEDPS